MTWVSFGRVNHTVPRERYLVPAVLLRVHAISLLRILPVYCDNATTTDQTQRNAQMNLRPATRADGCFCSETVPCCHRKILLRYDLISHNRVTQQALYD